MAPVEVQGHRGYGDLAPHNTLAAFRAAAAHAGVQSVEFDVRRSADGHLVVTHGPEFGPHSDVEKATLAELRSQDLGGDEGVPTLEEVIDVCLAGGLIMNVELKAAEGSANVADTVALLRKKGALPSSRISSFDREMLKQVIAIAPEVPIGPLYHPGTGLVDPDDKSKGYGYHEAPADFAEWFKDHAVEGDSVNLRAEAVLRTPSLIEAAKSCGKQVMVWFPCRTNVGFEDGEETYRRLLDLPGVDVICCNRPDLLAELVAKMPAEEEASGGVKKRPAAKRARLD